MAITWADILDWTTGPLESAATDLVATSKALVSAANDGQDATNGIQSQGSAVTAIRTAASTNMTALARLATNVNSAMMAIEGARDRVATLMANIQNAQAYAAENHCTINADGTVSSNAYNESDSVKTQAMLAAAELETTIKQIIKDADQIDTDLYHAMSDINNDRATDGDKGGDNKVIGVPDHPNKNWTPSQNAAWWNSLSGKQQQHLIDHCPEEIRHLDGLPASVRDKANRNALYGYTDDMGRQQCGELEGAKRGLKDAQDSQKNIQKYYDAALADANTDEKTREELRQALDKADQDVKQRQEHYDDLQKLSELTNNEVRRSHGQDDAYIIDLSYDVKHHRTTAIVSSGNPDTASYVSTLVPGIGTNVRENLEDYMTVNENLKAQTAQVGTNPHDVATISYLGYVAPEGPGGKIYQAADIGYADRAAPDLARFEEGLRASGNANGHSFTNTLISHSYGSTTAGKAMTQVAKGTVDNFIMCGSPGSGAESIDQYNVPEGHVYESSVPEGDAVQGLGPDSDYGTDPQDLDGITHLSGDTTTANKYWTGKDALLRFGFNPPLQVADTVLNAFSNHMSYLDPNTRAFQDFANIIGGGQQTTDEEWRDIKSQFGR